MVFTSAGEEKQANYELSRTRNMNESDIGRRETFVSSSCPENVAHPIISGTLCAFPSKVRERIRARDGGRCVVCGSTDYVQAHHKIPTALGGSDTPSNGVLLCGNNKHSHHTKYDLLAINQGIAYPDIPFEKAPLHWFRNPAERKRAIMRYRDRR